MKKVAVLLTFAVLSVLPVSAQQGYHRHYGSGRVVQQNQTGLYQPAMTQIGCGTLSQSAQGFNSPALNGALPTVSMGGTIRTPGDNLYNGNLGMRRAANGAVVYQDQLDAQRQMAMFRQFQMQQARMQQQMRYSNPYGNYYVPGSNGGAASYGGGGSGVRFSNGVASYGSYGGKH